jgi:hypothetical protein
MVKQWRGDPAIADGLEGSSAGDESDQPVGKVRRIEVTLMEIRQRMRDRRQLTGKPPIEIAEEELNRRATDIVEEAQADLANGKELTPMHLVLAARYIEGEINLDEYRQAVLHL